MTEPRLPIELGEIIHPIDDLPPQLYDREFRMTCVRLDRYLGALIVELASALGLDAGDLPEAATLCRARGWAAEGELAVRWLLETLALYGHAEPSGGGWRYYGSAADVPSGARRDEAVSLFPAAAPSYRVFDLCAEGLPAVLRGERRGEELLFNPSTLGLWFEYFSNDNVLYGISNRLTAVAVERAVRPGARILEVGGGGGSAAQAILQALAAADKSPAGYLFTELHPAFLRRGTRTAQAAAPPGCEVAAQRYDINLPADEQGLAGRRFDLIVGVNTLHLATDPVAALARLRGVLSPGGALVLGELIRPEPEGPVHIELPFTLLEAYRNAPLIDGIRLRPGFIALAGWRRALERAGFADVTVLPRNLAGCVADYAGFYSGALTARG
jgi:SAM-dependent methyltransferase